MIVRRLAISLARSAAVLRRVLGAPDYERYLEHVRRRHPGLTPLSREAYLRDALARRYDRPGSRCC
ncbi:MAG TPA: YbdD/YjiX family protein [Gemmatimonadaceae bacterium]